MNISITEFLQDKIKCPYMEKPERPDYNGANIKYNLSDPGERGQYLHAYIANKIDNIPFKWQQTSYNEQAKDILRWMNEQFPLIKFNAEQTFRSEKDGITITGKPDAYAIVDNKLIVIDYKFSDKFSKTYFDQIVFYAGLITEQNTEITDIELWIKKPGNEPSFFCFDRTTVMQLYEEIVSRVIYFVRETGRTPDISCCDKCCRLVCTAKAEFASSEILSTIYNKTDEEDDFTDDEMKQMAYAILCIKQMEKEIVNKYDGEKKKSFQSCPEVVEAVEKASKGKADIKKSVTKEEAIKWLGEKAIEKYKTKESRPTINELARSYKEKESENDE